MIGSCIERLSALYEQSIKRGIRAVCGLLLLVTTPVVTANPFCENYANGSTQVAREYKKLRCGPEVPRYSENWQGHFNWCNSVAKDVVNREAAARDNGLAKCKTRVVLLPGLVKSPRPGIDPTTTSPAIKSGVNRAPKDKATKGFSTDNVLLIDTQSGSSKKRVLKSPGAINFAWRIPKQNVVEVIYQIAFVPFEEDKVEFRPTGILEIGVSKRALQQGLLSSGQFTVEPWKFTDYAGRLREGNLAKLPIEEQKIRLVLLAQAGTVKADKDRSAKPQFTDPVVVPATNFTQQPNRLYVRVIPVFDDGSAATFASNTFEITLPKPGDAAYKPYTALVKFEPGYEPDFFQAKCVRVTDFVKPKKLEVMNKETAALFLTRRFYSTTGTFCPWDWDSDSSCSGFECFGDAIVQGFEMIVDTFDKIVGVISDIKDKVIELSAIYNPLCLQAGLIDDDAADVCETIVDVGTNVVVDAYLASNGIPPKLPTSSDLVAAAKGDVTELTVAMLEKIGVPCDQLVLSEAEAKLAQEAAGTAIDEASSVNTDGGIDLCRDMTRAVVDEMHQQLKVHATQKAAKAAAVPYFNNIVMIPEPRGQWQPPRIEMTLLPTGAPIRSDINCSADVRVGGAPRGALPFVNPSTVEPYRAKRVNLPKPDQSMVNFLTGIDFAHTNNVSGGSGGIRIIPTNPIKFSTLSVVLDEPNNVDLKLNNQWVSQRREQYRHTPSDHRNLQLAGNQLTATVDSLCFEKVSITQSVSLASSRPAGGNRGELPQWYKEWWSKPWRRQLCQSKLSSLGSIDQSETVYIGHYSGPKWLARQQFECGSLQ